MVLECNLIVLLNWQPMVGLPDTSRTTYSGCNICSVIHKLAHVKVKVKQCPRYVHSCVDLSILITASQKSVVL